MTTFLVPITKLQRNQHFVNLLGLFPQLFALKGEGGWRKSQTIYYFILEYLIYLTIIPLSHLNIFNKKF